MKVEINLNDTLDSIVEQVTKLKKEQEEKLTLLKSVSDLVVLKKDKYNNFLFGVSAVCDPTLTRIKGYATFICTRYHLEQMCAEIQRLLKEKF